MNERHGEARSSKAGSRGKIKRWVFLLSVPIVACAAFWLADYNDFFSQKLSAPANERASFVLKDGSVVLLNKGTTISVKYKEDAHSPTSVVEVRMGDGEALFKLSAIGTRTFVVRTLKSKVQALHEDFAINQSQRESFITALRGNVEIFVVLPKEYNALQGDRAMLVGSDGSYWINILTVQAGEQAVLGPQFPASILNPDADIKAAVAWAEGM